MTEQQLLSFLTVCRTLNFSAAARELYCTQPALSYQIRSLEKELGVSLFQRSTTLVSLTDAGRTLLPHAQESYRHLLNAYAALKGLSQAKQLTLRLPQVLLQRDPIYPVLMEALHEALPAQEWTVDTRTPTYNLHQLLCTEADAVLCPVFAAPPPEVVSVPVAHNVLHLVLSPDHPLADRAELTLADLSGQKIYYEPIYQLMVDSIRHRKSVTFSVPQWIKLEGYEAVYSEMLSGQAMFLYSMCYPCFPDAKYIRLQLPQPLPDTCLFTLRDDSRPEIETLREVFSRVYRKFGYL